MTALRPGRAFLVTLLVLYVLRPLFYGFCYAYQASWFAIDVLAELVICMFDLLRWICVAGWRAGAWLLFGLRRSRRSWEHS